MVQELVKTDINSAKLIVFIGVMATDQLLFEFVYEVYCYSADYMSQISSFTSKLKEGTEQIILMHFTSDCFIQYLLVLS